MPGSKKGRVITQTNRLTDYQKNVIEYLIKSGKTLDQVVSDPELKRSDGSAILKKTVLMWKQRFESEGNMKVRDRSGRKRLLDGNQEKELVNYIKRHNKLFYRELMPNTNFEGSCRSLNRYANRNNIGTQLNQCD